MDLIKKAVEDGIKKAGGDPGKLAKILGVSRPAVVGWRSGTKPVADNWIELMVYLGRSSSPATDDTYTRMRKEIEEKQIRIEELEREVKNLKSVKTRMRRLISKSDENDIASEF